MIHHRSAGTRPKGAILANWRRATGCSDNDKLLVAPRVAGTHGKFAREPTSRPQEHCAIRPSTQPQWASALRKAFCGGTEPLKRKWRPQGVSHVPCCGDFQKFKSSLRMGRLSREAASWFPNWGHLSAASRGSQKTGVRWNRQTRCCS
jgi:hypothetical protein